MTPWDLVVWFIALALGVVLMALAAGFGIGVIRHSLGYRDIEVEAVPAPPDTPDRVG